MTHTRRNLLLLAALLLAPPASALGQEVPSDRVGPSACTGGVITSIELERGEPFQADSVGSAPVAWTYGLLNALHVTTRPAFIRDELLVGVGDCYDDFLVSESQRLLDAYPFLEIARIEAVTDSAGGRALRVRTRDAWSTNVGAGVTYDNGINLESFGVSEINFLGRGLRASFSHREFREVSAQSLRLSTPRLFGRTDAGIEVGRDRPGTFFSEYLRYPFLGDTGRFSVRHGYNRGTSYFAYATPVGDPRSQIFVPSRREFLEFSAARRFGQRGRSLIIGLTLSREVGRYDAPRAVLGGDFDDAQPIPSEEVPTALAGQLGDNGASRVWLHLGARRFRYIEYRGLDAVRERQLVGLGAFAGVSVGRGFDLLVPSDVEGQSDTFVRGRASATTGLGRSLFQATVTGEARHIRRRWRDRFAGAELVGYLRGRALPGQTLFLRSSFAEGRDATIPFQLSLGGRRSVRSLPEDVFPGGRTLRFVVEDRIALPWPRNAFDLGLTLFADAGRIWPGDAPLGVDSGWQYAAGGGIRFALPARSRYAWRADLAFPVGPTTGDPIFRITFELNRLANGFWTPDLARSSRFGLGAESF